ncbi:Protein MAIN-LIKE 1 [Glycine soja]
MVRTRGLGHALGHITGRGVGRGDRDDSDDAPQRRWPTASARRQRVPVTVAHDEPVVPVPDVEADVFPDDPIAPADAAEDEHEEFPGGPSDPSMLTQYVDHVACSVWAGEERPELKLSSHGRKVHSLARSVPTIEGLVAGTGLSPLIVCSIDIGDRGLLSSFVERWHRETSSFHLLMGELTITLDDVSSLLHLPVVGDLHAFQPLHVDDAIQMLVDLLMVSAEAIRAETGQCRGPYVRQQTHFGVTCSTPHCNIAGHHEMLVPGWIYEHFVTIGARNNVLGYKEKSPCVSWWSNKSSLSVIHYKKLIDELTIKGVRWTPYETQRNHRSFENISLFFKYIRLGLDLHLHLLDRNDPRHLFVFTDEIPTPQQVDDRWLHSQNHLIQPTVRVVQPIDCNTSYYVWFYRVSHPFVQPIYSAPPLDATMDQAHLAVETCYRIGRLLQRVIDHRLVAQGIDAYSALALARRVTDNGPMNTSRAWGGTRGGHGRGEHMSILQTLQENP